VIGELQAAAHAAVLSQEQHPIHVVRVHQHLWIAVADEAADARQRTAYEARQA